MLMCDECFTLFEPYTKLDFCPIRGCDGELVLIDDPIAELISDLNQKLIEHSYPMRTVFSCSGHSYNECHPYIGFQVYVDTEDELNGFLENILDKIKPSLDRLNYNLSQIQNIDVIDPFKIYPDVLSFPSEKYSPEYRIFVNGFHFKCKLEDSYSKSLSIFQIQALFQQFLLDLVYSL